MDATHWLYFEHSLPGCGCRIVAFGGTGVELQQPNIVPSAVGQHAPSVMPRAVQAWNSAQAVPFGGALVVVEICALSQQPSMVPSGVGQHAPVVMPRS